MSKQENRELPKSTTVLVAGAGPAGLAAARKLAAGGILDIVVVDSRRKIGTPVRCAELTRSTIWRDLGTKPRKDLYRRELRNPAGYVVDRARMEAEGAMGLRAEGVKVFESATVVGVGPYAGGHRSVTIAYQGGTHVIKTTCVIAADGIASKTARFCGIPTLLPLEKIASAMAYRMTGIDMADAGTAKVEYIDEMYPAYYWAFPTGEHEANVGLVLPSLEGSQVKRMLDAWIAAQSFARRASITETIVGMIPIARPLQKPYADGVLVAGTAARFVNPQNSEGIWYALKTGIVAAETFLVAESTREADLAVYVENLAPYYEDLDARWDGDKVVRNKFGFGKQQP